jgi:hypothetical protein
MHKKNMNEMQGKIAMEFDRDAMKQLCVKYIPGYEEERYEVVAIRLYCAGEIILTIYARDKSNSGTSLPVNKFPVKKFKKQIDSPAGFFEFVKAFNFTISAEDYDMHDMEVTNR